MATSQNTSNTAVLPGAVDRQSQNNTTIDLINNNCNGNNNTPICVTNVLTPCSARQRSSQQPPSVQLSVQGSNLAQNRSLTEEVIAFMWRSANLGKLEVSCAQFLLDHDFPWEEPDSVWESNFLELKDYLGRLILQRVGGGGKSCAAALTNLNDVESINWISVQSLLTERGMMPLARLQKLDTLYQQFEFYRKELDTFKTLPGIDKATANMKNQSLDQGSKGSETNGAAQNLSLNRETDSDTQTVSTTVSEPEGEAPPKAPCKVSAFVPILPRIQFLDGLARAPKKPMKQPAFYQENNAGGKSPASRSSSRVATEETVHQRDGIGGQDCYGPSNPLQEDHSSFPATESSNEKEQTSEDDSLDAKADANKQSEEPLKGNDSCLVTLSSQGDIHGEEDSLVKMVDFDADANKQSEEPLNGNGSWLVTLSSHEEIHGEEDSLAKKVEYGAEKTTTMDNESNEAVGDNKLMKELPVLCLVDSFTDSDEDQEYIERFAKSHKVSKKLKASSKGATKKKLSKTAKKKGGNGNNIGHNLTVGDTKKEPIFRMGRKYRLLNRRALYPNFFA